MAVVSALRPLVSEIEHQSCGVDSYSVEDCARENMSMLGITPVIELLLVNPLNPRTDGFTDDEFRSAILICEAIRWAQDLATKPLESVLEEIREAYLVD